MKSLKDYLITEVSKKLIDNAYTKSSGAQKNKIKKLAKDVYNYNPQQKLTNKEDLQEILEERLAKDKNANLNDIDVSGITDMSYLFGGISGDPHNIDISEWDVSNVKNMKSMFEYCRNFNCDLSKWDVSNVENMYNMFYECKSFKGKGLENWNVSNVKDMSSMFEYCEKFDCDLSNWDISKVEDIDAMFDGCKKFNCEGLEKWNLSEKLIWSNMRSTFDGCRGRKPSWYKN